MQDFESLLNDAAQEPTITSWPKTKFDVTFQKFCDWLNSRYSQYLRVMLKQSSAPRVYNLFGWPKGRRNDRTILLTVLTGATEARILGRQEVDFHKTEDFQQYLADMIKSPAFRNTLANFKKMSIEPVAGVLRVGANRTMATLLADIEVELIATEQQRLADASESIPPTPRIDKLRVDVKRGTYSQQRPPSWLIAGGYAMSVDRVIAPSVDQLFVTGEPVPAEKLD